jgi:hypothetical protein
VVPRDHKVGHLGERLDGRATERQRPESPTAGDQQFVDVGLDVRPGAGPLDDRGQLRRLAG